MTRVVVDLGNTRLKWGTLAHDGTMLAEMPALPVRSPEGWEPAFRAAGLDRAPTRWAIASVSPAAASTLEHLLAPWNPAEARWFRRAADVDQPHRLAHPDKTGADRALNVLAARALVPSGTPFQVVSCGSAITVDAVSESGLWLGGAIAPGLPLASRSLHAMTAQLPMVSAGEPAPPAIGDSTEPAIQAGLFWGLVGAVREILHRQADTLGAPSRILWTGGDAGRIAPWVSGDSAEIHPTLVLRGLAAIGFGPS